MFRLSQTISRRILLFSCLALLSISCTKDLATSIVSEEESYDYHKERSQVLRVARTQIGKHYKYAGNGPDHWDCSGLTFASYDKVEIKLPRTARAMSKLDDKGIEVKDSKPGDLIFFKKGGRVFHVSIITEYDEGKLWVVHSTTSQGVVEEDVLASSYWKEKIHKVISLETLIEAK